ncbi:hypothetical protein D3C75_861750 [compost metagenome]
MVNEAPQRFQQICSILQLHGGARIAGQIGVAQLHQKFMLGKMDDLPGRLQRQQYAHGRFGLPVAFGNIGFLLAGGQQRLRLALEKLPDQQRAVLLILNQDQPAVFLNPEGRMIEQQLNLRVQRDEISEQQYGCFQQQVKLIGSGFLA